MVGVPLARHTAKLALPLLAIATALTACDSTEPEMSYVSLAGTVYYEGSPSAGWSVRLVWFEHTPGEGSGWGNLFGWGGGDYGTTTVEELGATVSDADGRFVVDGVVVSDACANPPLGLEVVSADSSQPHWGVTIDVQRDWPYYGIPCGEGTKYDIYITAR